MFYSIMNNYGHIDENLCCLEGFSITINRVDDSAKIEINSIAELNLLVSILGSVMIKKSNTIIYFID